MDSLYLNGNGELVGINFEKKYIMIWKNDKEVTIHNFPNEIIKKMIKVNDTQICLLLEATISREFENEFTVEKYNKMEIFDIDKNRDVAKKAVLKLEYKIDIDSAIVGLDGSIIFILNENNEGESKKYIFKWAPFCEDKKKESKKREIADANKYHSIKLFPFERILTFKKGKDVEMYDLFGKATESSSQVTLFDFSAKKIGQYDISGDIKQIELGQNNQIYALGKDKFSIYEINSNHKNRLEKIHELEVAVSFIYPFDNFIIMKKEASILIYDRDFDLVMKEEEDQDVSNYKILKVSDKKFILANDQELSLWDLDNESKTSLQLNEASLNPNLVELVGGKNLLVADTWIKSYDFYELLR